MGAVAPVLLHLLEGRLTGLAVRQDGFPFDEALGRRLGRNSEQFDVAAK